MNIFRKIDYKIDDFFWELKNSIRKIKVVIDWIPILWKSPDYDYYGLFEVMAYKMVRMRNSLSEDENAVKSLTAVIEDINAYISNSIENMSLNEFYSKYPQRPLQSCIENNNGIICYNSRMTPEEKEEYLRVNKNIVVKEKELKEKIFKNLNENIESWWS